MRGGMHGVHGFVINLKEFFFLEEHAILAAHP